MKYRSNRFLFLGSLGFLAFVHSELLMAQPSASAQNASSASPVAGQKPRQLSSANAGEGPAWYAPSSSLFFVGGNRITRYKSDGTTEVFREPAGGANGLLLDFQGRLVVCEAESRRVTRTEPNGAITVLADSYEGKKFNSPNDLS